MHVLLLFCYLEHGGASLFEEGRGGLGGFRVQGSGFKVHLGGSGSKRWAEGFLGVWMLPCIRKHRVRKEARNASKRRFRLLKGSWDLISKVLSTLSGVISTYKYSYVIYL